MTRILFILITALMAHSCSKEDATIAGNWLEMKVTNSSGQPVQDAEIYLYSDKVEWANYENPVAVHIIPEVMG